MTAIEPESAAPTGDDRIATIAGAIFDAYGANGVLVARRQLDVADDASRADWVAILAHLERC